MKHKASLLFCISLFVCQIGFVGNSLAASPSLLLCKNKKNAIIARSKCKKGEKRLALSDFASAASDAVVGVKGAQGPIGPSGNDGAQGPAGPVGASGPQGIQGPQGPQGALGPIGDPGGFDFSSCYSVTSGPINGSVNSPLAVSVACANATTQYLGWSSFAVEPGGSSTNKPFLQAKDWTLDASSKYPIGVSYTFLQAVSGGNGYKAQVYAICCSK